MANSGLRLAARLSRQHRLRTSAQCGNQGVSQGVHVLVVYMHALCTPSGQRQGCV